VEPPSPDTVGAHRDAEGDYGPTLTPGCPPSIRSVMQKYLEDRGEVTFDKIFAQKIGEWGLRGGCGAAAVLGGVLLRPSPPCHFP